MALPARIISILSVPSRWLALLLFAAIGSQANAAPAPTSIRVVLDDNYPPYIFRDSGGQVQGILKDLWDLWQQRTGIAVDFQPMDWAKARASMESGQADVIDTIFETEERRKIYDFSRPYATIEVPIFFHRSISGIHDAASIKGFTVGVKDGDACIDYLKAHGIGELKLYASYEAQVKAAVAQEIRVLCIDTPPAFYFFSRAGAIDEFRHSPPLYVGEFHWAVAKGRTDIKQLVEQGFSRISADERAAIETRWMGARLPSQAWSVVARYGSYVLLVVALVVVALFIWNFALRRRVAVRTVALELANSSARESEARYRALADLSADWYWEQDEDLRFTSMSKPNTGQAEIELGTFLGHTRRDAPGIIWDEGELNRLEAITQARRPFRHFEMGRIYRNGAKHYVSMSGEPMFDASGAFKGYRGVGSDITERKQTERALQESQARYRNLVENTPDLITSVDVQGRFVFVNSSAQTVFGLAPQQCIGLSAFDFVHPEDRQATQEAFREWVKTPRQVLSFENRQISRGGAVHLMQWSVVASYSATGELCGFDSVARDVTQMRKAQEQIQALAFSDPLTGLPNRRLLMDRLEQALAAASRHGHQDALLFIDLDDFKTLNDTLGHDKGDLLLKQITQRLVACVRGGDTVARLSGDEFVVLLQELSGTTPEAAMQAQAVAAKILSALAQPYELEGHGHHSTASIGVTLFGSAQRENVEEPLKRAELAMYQAKAAGRNTLRFFEPEMRTAVATRAALEADLREAVSKGQFLLYYQAQGGDQARLKGVEALVRWQHPQRGLVSPAEFIPIAEASGLILPLGRWVLQTACQQLAAWANRPERSRLTMAVNVSARQIRQSDFVQEVLSILQATGAAPERLKLELTESVLLDNVQDIIAKMSALKAKGVGFSLDDFGTGYSSLSYLKRLPLDQLKIDQGFVRDILIDANDAAIAKMVVALAESLGLEVIAEGVETEAQRDFLAKLGCHNYQGYLLSRPVPIEEFEAFAKQV